MDEIEVSHELGSGKMTNDHWTFTPKYPWEIGDAVSVNGPVRAMKKVIKIDNPDDHNTVYTLIDAGIDPIEMTYRYFSDDYHNPNEDK